MAQPEPMLDLHTFSIVARDSRTGEFGVAVSTARPNVGSLAPFVSRHGAIATQARVNTDLGRQGLTLLDQGVPIHVALRSLLEADPEREIRQVHGLDAEHAFCHTGADCVPWCSHESGPDFTVAGNMLVGPQVLQAMATTFSVSQGERELSERLLLALEAGQAAGGDKRGKQSAAILVWSAEPRLYHNLRVDEHPDPVTELRRIYDRVVAHTKEIERDYGPEGLQLFGRVKY